MIKILTMVQPWAMLAALGARCIDVRTSPTAYRGPVLIRAARNRAAAGLALCRTEPFAGVLAAAGIDPRAAADLPTGIIIAQAELVACVRIGGCCSCDCCQVQQARRLLLQAGLPTATAAQEPLCGAITPGRFAWVLAGARRIDAGPLVREQRFFSDVHGGVADGGGAVESTRASG